MILSLLKRILGRPMRWVRGPAVVDSARGTSMERLALLCRKLTGRPAGMTIGLASPAGGEGCSLVAGGLAEALASHGTGAVLKVEFCNGHAAQLDGRELSLPLNVESLCSTLLASKGVSCLRLPSGVVNGQDVLVGLQSVLNALHELGISVVIDLPAARSNSEALSLTHCVDGVILVLEAEVTRWEVARSAQRMLEDSGARILGAVLNKRRHLIPQQIYSKL
jgi:hypothetical protein